MSEDNTTEASTDEKEFAAGFTKDDLGAKIGNEGFDYFFGDYMGASNFEGSPIYEQVKAYIEAKDALKKALEANGVSLDY